ncbi:major facilitator superfamily MFS_1 [Elusimicrobium minutum Pei191]|uniref:Major facilitator superfamily MFS_1 n=1 Tax=Elusimicrobium minutum (strain Pei191) TaxID=445932 RepID=B2KDF1_ELUMP|nr:MFS transporter [Elusimicrobium minutum]ACC98547.1 major facilitator superfamily MFS_1 [Elusimicrobium minutum Pei191]
MKIKQYYNNILGENLGSFLKANIMAFIGLNIGIIGVNWFIINVTGQNRILGVYGAVSLIASFCALLFFGSLADKYNKIKILKFCLLIEAFIFIAAAGLNYLNFPVIFLIYGLAVLSMPVMMLYAAVSRAALAQVAPAQKLIKGNSVFEIAIQCGAVLAALATGFIYHGFGFNVLMLTASFTLLLSYIMLDEDLAGTDLNSKSHAGKTYFENLKEGLRYFRENKVLLLFGLIVFFPGIVIAASNTVIPGYVEQFLKQDSRVYGAGEMFFASGALLSGFLTAWVSSFIKKELLQFVLFVLSAAVLFSFSLNRFVAGFYIAIFLSGLFIASLRIILNAKFMELTGKEFLGRTIVFLTAITTVFQAALVYFIGYYMDVFKVTDGYLILTIVILAGFAGVYILKPEQKKREP